MRVSMKIVFAVALGLSAGAFTLPSRALATGCEANVCDTSDGNCTTTDVQLNCTETAGTPGCKSSICAAN